MFLTVLIRGRYPNDNPDQRNGCRTSPQVQDEAANVEPVSPCVVEMEDVDGGWDVVEAEGS